MAKDFVCDQFNDGSVVYLTGTAQPSAGSGVAAGIGSRYLRTGGAGGLWIKTAAGDTAWREIGSNEAIEDESQLGSPATSISLTIDGDAGVLYRYVLCSVESAGATSPFISGVELRLNGDDVITNYQSGFLATSAIMRSNSYKAHGVYYFDAASDQSPKVCLADGYLFLARSLDGNNVYAMVNDHVAFKRAGDSTDNDIGGWGGCLYLDRSANITTVSFHCNEDAGSGAADANFAAGSWASISRVLGFDYQ